MKPKKKRHYLIITASETFSFFEVDLLPKYTIKSLLHNNNNKYIVYPTYTLGCSTHTHASSSESCGLTAGATTAINSPRYIRRVMSIPRADCSCLIIFTIESLDILCSALWVWPIVCPSVCRQACNYYLIFRRMMMWSITHSIISSLRSLQHYRRDRFVLHFEMSSGLPSERRKESERVHCSWLPPCVCCSVHAKRIVSGFFGLYNLGIPNEIFSSDVLIAAEYTTQLYTSAGDCRVGGSTL